MGKTLPALMDLSQEQIEAEIVGMGEKAFRARQITEWIYIKRSPKISEFSNLPSALRDKLEKKYSLRVLKLESRHGPALDGTVRFNFETADGCIVPCVFLPSKDRNTLCVSSQAGCPVGCTFCASGKAGFKRNLSRGEILEQVISGSELSGRRVTGVLFMGMGEPFLNYDNVASAVRALTGFKEMGIGRRHITVSTVGLVPEIRKFADEKPGVRLALSLHAPDEDTRARLIGARIRYPIKDILEAGLYYSRTNNSRLTVEYMLAAGVNDTLQHAQKLAKLLNKSVHGQRDDLRVNLIPYNASGRAKWKPPEQEEISRFKNDLADNGITAMVRLPRGLDITAACGQLGV